MTGTVFKSTGSFYLVKTNQGMINCRVKGKLRLAGIKSTNPVAVGDLVKIQLENEKEGIIVSVEERRNYIVRKSVNLSKRTHIIAANLDQAILIVTLVSPKTFPQFIDRFLATAEAYSIPTVIVFNKIDLFTEDDFDELQFLTAVYSDIGYKVLHTSAEENKGLEDLQEVLVDKVSLLSGHSGVGKSTLVNKLQSTLDLKTKPISDAHNQGQHTTTFAEMFELDFGGAIVDSPGIKGFGMVNMVREELTDFFPEMLAIKNQCKFHNCMHIAEPNCAIKTAVDENKISFTRYESYLSMINDVDGVDSYRADDYKS